MTNSSSSHSMRNLILLLILLLIAITSLYYYNRYQADKRLANQSYQQLAVIDGELDNLEGTAKVILAEKAINAQVANIIGGLSKDNFFANKAELLAAVNKLTYDTNARSKFESQIAEASPANVKNQLKLIRETLREVKYQHNREVTAFNQQLGKITAQVITVKSQVMKIKSENLQQLELAKLDFITKKLNKTAHQLSSAFFTTLVNDVVDAAIDAAESQPGPGAGN